MKILRTVSVLCAIVCSSNAILQAGIFSRGCADSCTEQCCDASCDPSDYCCVSECKSEKVKLPCFESKCEAVVIPPVKFPCGGCCFSKLRGRGKCGSCCNSGCAGASDGCGNGSCCGGSGNNGLLSKLFGKFAKCRVRCVSKYKKSDYECGTKCVCEWKAVQKGGCGNGCGTGAGCSEGY